MTVGHYQSVLGYDSRPLSPWNIESNVLMQTHAFTCFISNSMLLQLKVNSCRLTERTTPD